MLANNVNAGSDRRHRSKTAPRKSSRLFLWIEQLDARVLLSASPMPNYGINSTPSVLHTVAVPVLGGIVKPGAGTTSPQGFSPGQIQNAYGFNQIKSTSTGITLNGAGETIAIVDAYDDPDLVDSTSTGFGASELHQFYSGPLKLDHSGC